MRFTCAVGVVRLISNAMVSGHGSTAHEDQEYYVLNLEFRELREIERDA